MSPQSGAKMSRPLPASSTSSARFVSWFQPCSVVSLHAEQRDAVDGVQVDAVEAQLVEIGHQLEAEAVALAVVAHAQDLAVKDGRQGNDDLVHAV